MKPLALRWSSDEELYAPFLNTEIGLLPKTTTEKNYPGNKKQTKNKRSVKSEMSVAWSPCERISVEIVLVVCGVCVCVCKDGLASSVVMATAAAALTSSEEYIFIHTFVCVCVRMAAVP